MDTERRNDRLLGHKVRRFQKTPDFIKARALELYAEIGLVETAVRLGLDRSTINRWRREAAIPSRLEVPLTPEDVQKALAEQEGKRVKVRGMLLAKSELMLSLIDAGMKPEDMKYIAGAVSTLLDKYRLEAGEVTDRTERHTEVGTNESRELLDAVAREIRGRAARTVDGTARDVAAEPPEGSEARSLQSVS